MIQIGKVLSVSDNTINLEVKRVSGCGSNCQNCAASCDVKSEYISLVNTLNAKVGDYVELQSSSEKVILYIALIYGLPLLFLIVGILVGNFLLGKLNIQPLELYSILFGFLFMSVAYFVVRIIDKNSKVELQKHIKMVRIISP